ncbi:hypothetical protein KP509_23G030900 [Ceratopteris richardii]|nr:hypothetical protein KP509_23G030900 [Ceratopteris richardii]
MHWLAEPFTGSPLTVALLGTLFLLLLNARNSAAENVIATPPFLRLERALVGNHAVTEAALARETSMMRISALDLQKRQEIERTIQVAAFLQYGSHRTGQMYDFSVEGFQPGDVRAVRLRSGSFRRYGVRINEFNVPQGCYVDPVPERILLVYTRFTNTTLFQDVPAGYVLASPVVSVLVYDAAKLGTSEIPDQISVSTSFSLISIALPQSANSKCAYYFRTTTEVNVSDTDQGTCKVDHLGAFAIVDTVLGSAQQPHEHSNTWKIVLGSVIGGLVLLLLFALLVWRVSKYSNELKLSQMEYKAEQGETLQMATIGASRVPTASSTRTQATLVNDLTS